jgi:hypothetical protein
MIHTESDIFLYSLVLGMAAFNMWFVGRMFEKAHRNRRDINAIAMRIREVEVVTATRFEALDFTVKSILVDKDYLDDTGFNLKGFDCGKD